MSMNRDNLTTQEEVEREGYKRLSAQELIELNSNKTMRGDYLFNAQWRIYLSYSNPDGTIEGVNDLGSFNEGRWRVDDTGLFSVEWDSYWDDWSGYAYHVDGKIKFYDSESGKWRTTFNEILDGKHPLDL